MDELRLWWPALVQLVVWGFMAGMIVMQIKGISATVATMVAKIDETLKLGHSNRLRIVRLESKVFGFDSRVDINGH